MKRRRRRRGLPQFRPTKKFYAILGGVVAVVLLVVLLITLGKEQVAVEQGTISFSTDLTGVLVRSEKLYKSENYGKTVFIAEEGAAATVGTQIAEVYTWDYSDSIVSTLQSIKEKIMDYQEQTLLKSVVDQDIESLTSDISAKGDEIRNLVMGQATGDLLKLERELKTLMSKRVELLRNAVKVDAQLQSFYDQETALLARIDGWKKVVTAELEGLVSFYFDGSELLLTPENMEKLSASELEAILAGKSYSSTGDSSSSRPLYRLVNENEWYVVVVSSQRVPEFEHDTAFTVSFSDTEDMNYTARIRSYKQDGKKYVYYLSFSQSVAKLLLARRVDMLVSNEFVGLKVAQKAIVTKNGETGVYAKVNDKKQFIAVNVLIRKDGQAIIEPKEMTSELVVGTKIYQ